MVLSSLGDIILSETDKIPEPRQGIFRALRAFRFSWHGFKFMLKEDAFKQEFVALLILAPIALFVFENTLLMKILMISSVIFVMITEVLNTAVEAVVDLVSPEYSLQAKMAKDMGSLAVLLSIIIALLVWSAALYDSFSAL